MAVQRPVQLLVKTFQKNVQCHQAQHQHLGSTTNAPTLYYPVPLITSPNSTRPPQYVSAVDGKCPAGSHEVG